MMPVADAVRGMLVAIALLVIRSWICGLVVFGQLTCQPPMSDIRTMSPDDRACDATAPCRQVQAQCARRSPTRAIVSMPSMHRQRQPAARARSPCCASGPSRSADAPQEPATNVCITSEGQLLIIRTVTKFNRPRDIADKPGDLLIDDTRERYADEMTAAGRQASHARPQVRVVTCGTIAGTCIARVGNDAAELPHRRDRRRGRGRRTCCRRCRCGSATHSSSQREDSCGSILSS